MIYKITDAGVGVTVTWYEKKALLVLRYNKMAAPAKAPVEEMHNLLFFAQTSTTLWTMNGQRNHVKNIIEHLKKAFAAAKVGVSP